ncbi:sodium/proton antiporter (CPA1 family) [Modicisalibacter xianhensis]|uniref:Sodium/proton antiporter (CPA1 family) n=1 Tax=Modicisalibacter xianhensis TaxID=442341 RepID=A0A4R8FG34_9GAMM|nr:cation:proton antiporter [Halomonas xianhensis]TDX24192.1 sodium/proton antiporter (CPA1 family) [Halomonas xianhensis]
MESHIYVLGGFGLLILLVAWFPIFIRNLPLTLPIICLAVGYAIFAVAGEEGLNPRDYPAALTFLTELTIIVSLTGAGLSIDKRLRWREWANTARLIGLAMPLSIAAIAALGAFFLGLPWEAAALLGAALAPTDPVLAADVRVGPPQAEPEDEVRFSLTSEAGLNDGLAFPFIFLAIGLASHGVGWGAWAWEWLLLDVVWRVAAGCAAGWMVGSVLGNIVYRVRHKIIARTGQGFASLGITFVAYAGAELIHGYGFIAVFVAALVMRRRDNHNEYNHRLYDFTEQAEHLLMMTLLVLFGGSLAGTLLDGLTWPIFAAAIVVLFVIRPVIGMLSLAGSGIYRCERSIVSLFGIRGVGSFYYLAYATNIEDFGEVDTVWTLVTLVVLISIVSYGMLSAPLMGWMDRRREIEAKSLGAQ